MARRPGEFRWSILPTIASYHIYRFERRNGRSLHLRKEVHERFGMPLSGSEMKVDRNLKEAYEIEFGNFQGKKGSNHHDRYVVREFEKYSDQDIEEFYNEIIHDCLSSKNQEALIDHAIELLRTVPKERDLYIAMTIEHGLNIRNRISEISSTSPYLYEKAFLDEEDNEFLLKVGESSGRSILNEVELESIKGKVPEPKKVNSSLRWPRDKSVSWTALVYADHKCEIDPTHVTFKRLNEDVSYVEPHHVIPIHKQSNFKINLDHVFNIIALCPNCHKAIHLADKSVRKRYIKEAFAKREEDFKRFDIQVTLSELFQFYNI